MMNHSPNQNLHPHDSDREPDDWPPQSPSSFVTGQHVKRLAVGGLVCLGLGSLLGLGGWYLRQDYEQARQEAAHQLERNQVGTALTQYQQARRNPWNWVSSDPVGGADWDWVQQEVEAIDLELAELEQQMAANPNQMADWIALGELLSRRGDWSGAEEAFRQAIAIDSAQSQAHFGLGQVLEQQGFVAEALLHYQIAAERVSSNLLYQTAWGRVLVATEQVEEGIRRLEAVIQQDPYRADTQHALSVAYARQQQWELAIRHGSLAWELGSSAPFDHLDPIFAVLRQQPATAFSAEQQGQAHLLQHHYPQAETAFSQAIAEDPTLANAYWGLGWARLQQNQSGVTAMTEAARLDQGARFQHGLGVALWQTAQNNEALRETALSSLQSAVDQAPQHPRYRRDWGLALAQAGQWEQSVAALESSAANQRWRSDPAVQRTLAVAQAQVDPASTSGGPSSNPPRIEVDLGRLRSAEETTGSQNSDSPNFEWSLLRTLLLWGSLTGVLAGVVWWAMTRSWGGQGRIPVASKTATTNTINTATTSVWNPFTTSAPLKIDQKGQMIQDYQKALLLTQAGQWRQAGPLLVRVLEVNPDYAPAQMLLGHAHRHEGDLNAALKCYDAAHRLHMPGSVRPLTELMVEIGERQLDLNDLQGSLQQFQQAEQLCLEDNGISKEEQAILKLKIAEVHIAAQAWSPALEQLRQTLMLNPNLAQALCRTADVYHLRGEFEHAIDTYWQALELDPDFLEAHQGMGLAMTRQGSLAAALAAFQTALSLAANPTVELRLEFGLALILAGNLAQAEPLIRAVLEQEPTNARAQYAMGKWLAAQGQYLEAIDHYQQALDLNPHLWDALAAQGLATLDHNKEKSDSGKRVLQSRQVESAISKFETVLQRDPNVVDAHFGIAEVHRMRNHLQFALKSYQDGLRVNRSHAPMHFQLGRLYVRWAKFDHAIESIRTALRLNPTLTQAQELLDRIYAKQAEDLRARTPSGAVSPSRPLASAHQMLQLRNQSTWDPEQAQVFADQQAREMAEMDSDGMDQNRLDQEGMNVSPDTSTDVITEIIFSEAEFPDGTEPENLEDNNPDLWEAS